MEPYRTMRGVYATLGLCCVLWSACSVDRLPITSAELLSDGGEVDAFVAPNADADVDAVVDAAIEVDAGVDAAVLADATAVTDAADDASEDAGQNPSQDAGQDAQVDVDAYVPLPRYVGPCESDHDCEFDELCLRTDGLLESHSYCAQRCTKDAQCAAGPPGSGAPRCTSSGRCRLPCDAVLGEGCPSAMRCQDFLLILPANDGTCSFRQ